MDIKIDWEGPFSVCSFGLDKSIFDSEQNELKGIYLWTIKTHKGYLVNYVGITNKSFRQRFATHIEYLYSGKSIIHNLDLFLNGIREPIFKPSGNIVHFMNNYEKISQHLVEYIKCFSVFIAPVKDLNKQVLERIESSLILALRRHEESKKILDNIKISRYITDNEEKLNIEMKMPQLIIGLPNKLTA